jgi:hypothetical protein
MRDMLPAYPFPDGGIVLAALSPGTSPRLPDTLHQVLVDLRGRYVQLTLEYAVSILPGGTLPIGRLAAVQTDYVVLDNVVVGGVRLRGFGPFFVSTGQIFAVAPVDVEEVLIDLALSLPGKCGPGS